MNILVTGAAGFIGFHTSLRLLSRGDTVLGVDSINDYYDPQIKRDRLSILQQQEKFSFQKADIVDKEAVEAFFSNNKIDRVIHLAAQAGVRYSLENPHAYIESNIIGFTNIIEGCRHNKIDHLTYASSSSVYGANESIPFSVHDNVDHPVSLYAATKKSNELIAHCYSHLFNLPTTGLRFFTVYGPWGRPDMALFLFTKAIIDDKPIKVFNNGNMKRDFTYIDDIVEGIVRVNDKAAAINPEWDGKTPDPGTSSAPYKVYNIGNHSPVELNTFIHEIEKCLGKEARRELMPIQPGDVPISFADVDDLVRDMNYRPQTPVSTGIAEFIKWYKEYFKV